MTSLNPSHNPFRKSEGRHAQAVRHPSQEDINEEPKSSLFPDTLPLSPSASDDESEVAEKKARWEGRKRVRGAMPAVPDLRFEQVSLRVP